MTGTPQVLPETPRAAADPLSELLTTMHLSGAVLFRAEFREPWAVTTPSCGELASILPFRTEHLIPFHLVAAGGCWLQMPDGEPVWLAEGDAVLMPHGDRHGLSGASQAEAVAVGGLLPPPPWGEPPVLAHGGAGDATTLICGFVQCDELLFHPLLRRLPALLHVRGEGPESDPWLASTVRRTIVETSRPGPGSRSMAARLTELMFVEVLRSFLATRTDGEVGWFAAFNNPVVGPALQRLHADPLAEWDVERLAREVGVSRTVLADGFRRLLDQPPMRYLAGWRLQLAAQALKSTDAPVKVVAEQSGYESEAAFSRAFKRAFGAPPADWRRRQGEG